MKRLPEKTPSSDLREALAQLTGGLADECDLSQSPRLELLEAMLGKASCRRLGIYRLPEDFLLSVVIPVYNEVNTLATVIDRVRKTGIPTEIILVDDGSEDGSRDLMEGWREQKDIKVVFHDKNLGKGAALKTGFEHVSGDAVVIQDADLEYDPAEYRWLLMPIVEDQADVVFGSRFSGDNQRVLYFWHYLGNRVLTTLSNCFTNLNLSDMETCYKVFRRDVIDRIGPTLREKRFGIEPELTAKVAGLPGIRIFERPVSYSGRTYSEGKKITWRDGLRALWCIVRYGRGRGMSSKE